MAVVVLKTFVGTEGGQMPTQSLADVSGTKGEYDIDTYFGT